MKAKNNKTKSNINWEISARMKIKYILKNGCKLCNAENFKL